MKRCLPSPKPTSPAPSSRDRCCWRGETFQREDLLKLFNRRRVVRATAMRATIHLFTARDYLALRRALQLMLGAVMPPKFIKELGGENIPKICATGRKFFGTAPQSFKDLRELLKSKHPKADHRIAALAVRMNVPLLSAPGDTPWGFSTNATWILADDWLGQPVPVQVDTPALIKKYLAAFGPATPADAQAWSGCKGLRAEFEKLRPQLKVFQNEKGQELFDLPRAPRPIPPRPCASFRNSTTSSSPTPIACELWTPNTTPRSSLKTSTSPPHF